MIALIAPGTTHAQATWAHQNGSLAPNGAVAIRSLSGGAYSGTQNPAGAVAKGAQAAATQPATVLIQATASQQELRTFVRLGVNVFPMCPTGFTAIFQYSGSDCSNSGIIYNAGGTNLVLGQANNGGSPLIGFGLTSGQPWHPGGAMGGGYSASAPMNSYLSCSSGPFSAEICAK